MKPEERARIQSEIFHDINSNATAVPRTVLTQIKRIRNPIDDESIAQSVVEMLNKEGVFRGLLQVSALDSGKIKTASIVRFALRYLVTVKPADGKHSLFEYWTGDKEALLSIDDRALQDYVKYCADTLREYFGAVKKRRGLLLSASIFPMMTNSVIRSFAWINILGSNGIINKAMIAMGLIEKPMKLLYTDFSIIIGSVYLFLPLMIVTVAGVMENIDDDMMEAAQSLGASRSEAFMKVIFPMSLPGIIVGGILVFTGTLTAYTTPQLLGGNSNMVMATLIYQRAMSVSDWTGASVIALIMIVVTLVVIKGFNALAARLDRRGEDYA